MTIEEAEGYLLLDMFEEALLALNDLSTEEVMTAPAMRIRMCASAALERWETAEVMAEILRHHPEDLYRFEAACCFQSLAAEHYKNGRPAEARKMVTAAIDTNPGHRLLILDDPRFPMDFV